jgi:glycosyltransferase involved in cell wall biosynthesis
LKFSVAIPCYEMHGRGAELLDNALRSIEIQDHNDIEVVVSDHSMDDSVENLCKSYADRLHILYLRYAEKRGSSSANTNNCLAHCSGELIKILCQDDILFGKSALSLTAKALKPGKHWLVSDYLHTWDHKTFKSRWRPRLNSRIEIQNSIGTHSGLTVRNGMLPRFDEDLLWFMDCEFYRQLYDRFGKPVYLHKPTVAVMIWDGQVTHTSASSQALRDAERQRLMLRYPNALADEWVIVPDEAAGPARRLYRRVAGYLQRYLPRERFWLRP